MRTIPILDIKKENSTVRTFAFKDELCLQAQPGQFIMLWIPRIDEIPLSIMNIENKKIQISVKAIGSATQTLHRMKKEDLIGVRGPFGNFFTKDFNKILIVSGGMGMAPLFFLAKKLIKKSKKLTLAIGAKTKNELLYLSLLKNMCDEHSIISTTEDGSYGFKGIITEQLDKLLHGEKYEVIYTCGPEAMIRRVFDIAERHQIYMEASLERYMRCGIGLCGSCVIGKYRVCRDGPIFNSSKLREIQNEFGFSKLDVYGKSIPL